MGTNEFFPIAAQVIPVLWLAMAFEQHSGAFVPDVVIGVFASPQSGSARVIRAVYALVVTVFLVVGEVAAIYGVVYQVDLTFTPGHVSSIAMAGLVVGGVGVVAPTVMTQVIEIFPESMRDKPSPFLGAVAVLSIVAVIWIGDVFANAFLH
jgi:hypothetical protein